MFDKIRLSFWELNNFLQHQDTHSVTGLVEQFNRTLKAILAKVVTNKGRDWDKYGRDAKLPTALNFHSPHPKTPVIIIYSDYGTVLFNLFMKLLESIFSRFKHCKRNSTISLLIQ